MSPFKLNRQDGLKVFFISFSDIDGRFDPLYYYSVNNLGIVNHTRYPVKKLSEVIEMQRGRFGHRPRNEPRFYGGEYPFIQTGDIVRASQTNGQITYSQTLNEMGLKTSRLFSEPVVVITIAANIGDTAILDYPACFPDSLIGMTPKTNELILEYINLYFKFIKTYLEDLAPQSAQKNINYQQLSPVPIVVPPLEIQQRVVQIYHAALIERQQKEQQAQAILAGIDAYLLAKLGIALPRPSEKKAFFYTRASKVSGGRLDPFYHQSEFEELEKAIFESKFEKCFLRNTLTFLESGSRPSGGVSQYESGVLSFGGEHINDKCEIEIRTPKYVPIKYHQSHLSTETKLHDILLVKDGATTGKIGIISDESHTEKNINEHVFMMRFSESVNPFFILNLLATSLYQKLTGKVITGATVTGLTKNVVRSLKIPLPPPEKQTEIADHISALRSQAKQLQSEAAQILADAKAEVERMILGE